ncbi:MAG: site-specific DNA-methyltransferase [Desulfitobacteriaceae bacterium]|nr:site-specific DNA-methyltransferase [Desulfitobacteriaceae bacterium]
MQIKKQISSVKAGDIFQLGDHRLLCGDAKDRNNVEKLINGDKIQLILTDPPYAIDYVNSKVGFKQKIAKAKTIENDQFQSEEDYRKFTKEWLSVVSSRLDKKNSIYIFNCDKMILALKQGMEDIGIYFSQLLVWIKNNAVLGRKDYLPQHELIAYGWLGGHVFHKAQDKSILFAPKPNKSKLHPTMKPIPLLRKIILNSTKVRDIVYDPFGGSGSTLIACEQTKRKCLMIELDIEYCQTIVDRYEKLTGIKAIKLN